MSTFETSLAAYTPLSAGATFDEGRMPRGAFLPFPYPETTAAPIVEGLPVPISSVVEQTPAAPLSAAERYPDHYIASAELVGQLRARQIHRVARLQVRGINPTLEVLIAGEPGALPDNESYRVQAQRYGQSIGAAVRLFRAPDLSPSAYAPEMNVAETEFVHRIGEIDRDPTVHGFLQLTPTDPDVKRWEGGQRHVQIAAGRSSKELDGIGILDESQELGPTSITAESLIYYIEHMTGQPIEKINPDEIAVIGNGQIGKGVRRILAERGVVPGVDVPNRQDVERLRDFIVGKPLRAVFGMARANGCLRAEDITPPTGTDGRFPGSTFVANAGNAPHAETGISGPNTSPDGLTDSDVYASPFIGGVGPLTVALLFNRVLDKAEAQLAEQIRYNALHRRVGGQTGALAAAVVAVGRRKPVVASSPISSLPANGSDATQPITEKQTVGV